MVQWLVNFLEFMIGTLYRDRTYSRFYVLETIARVPYFAFMSVLHLYETLGLWRKADWLKVHFAQSWNELHHLMIIEALGGDSRWQDKVLARSMAVIYYWILVPIYMVAPRVAYNYMQQVEEKAYHTYDEFLNQNEAQLKLLPAPPIAVKYYQGGDLYMFDEFQSTTRPESRRPTINNLYDVFVNIRDDESEHIKTIIACQHPHADQKFSSPHTAQLNTEDTSLVEFQTTQLNAAETTLVEFQTTETSLMENRQ